jgi:hypothetical protein
MKKLFLSILITILTISASYAADSETFQSLLNAKKPLALLIYASWADDVSDVYSAFNTAKNANSAKYNFKVLNIASEDTKEYNKTYYIYPNLPYVMLYKSQGKITRRLDKTCVMDASCLKEKLDLFAE